MENKFTRVDGVAIDGEAAFKCETCGVHVKKDYRIKHVCASSDLPTGMSPSILDDQLSPEAVAWVRQSMARARMDEAGPLMLEALRKCKEAMDDAITCLARLGTHYEIRHGLFIASESCRAAIAAAE